MNAGNLWFFLKILPLILFTAVIFSYFGWWLRRRFHAPVVSSSKPAEPDDLPARERVKKLEHSLAKAEAATKAARADLEAHHAKSIAKSAHEKVSRELIETQLKLEGDQKRIDALESELKRSRDTISNLSSKASDANKGQQERMFAMENELSRVRGELAALQAKPDLSLELQSEVNRLREALINSTRVVGELRKQESAAVTALEKVQKKLDAALAKTAAPEIPPLVSMASAFNQTLAAPAADRTAGAKADVERIEAAAEKAATELAIAQEAAAAQAAAAAQQAAAQQAAAEQAAAEQAAAAQQAAAQQAAAEQAAAEQAAAEQAAAEQAAAEQAAAAQAAAEQAAAQQAAAQQAAAEQAAAEQAAAEQAAAEQAAAEQAAAEQATAQQAAAEQAAAQQAAAEQAAAEQAAVKAAADNADAENVIVEEMIIGEVNDVPMVEAEASPATPAAPETLPASEQPDLFAPLPAADRPVA
jgi:hypothetical protein